MLKEVLKLKRLGSKTGHDRRPFVYTQQTYNTQCNTRGYLPSSVQLFVNVATEWGTTEKTPVKCSYIMNGLFATMNLYMIVIDIWCACIQNQFIGLFHGGICTNMRKTFMLWMNMQFHCWHSSPSRKCVIIHLTSFKVQTCDILECGYTLGAIFF